MHISLTPDNENFLRNQIAAGIYKNIDEAINAAINLIIVDSAISQKFINSFNNEVKIGIEAMEKGDVLDGQKVLEEFRKKYA